MRVAYLDCFSGISGDMFLGALIDAGVSPKIFEQTVEALKIGARLEISRVNRSGISATKVDVIVKGEKDSPREGRTRVSDPHEHSHSHDDHHHDVHHHAPHPHEHRRGLNEIRAIIRSAEISEPARNTATAIFDKLGEAESKIHNVPIDQIIAVKEGTGIVPHPFPKISQRQTSGISKTGSPENWQPKTGN